MRLSRSLPLLVALLGATPSAVRAGSDSKVKVSTTSFTNLPMEFFYFEDSSSLLSFDTEHGVVYRSDDSGATWNAIKEGSGKAWDLYQHPFDNEKAYMLTTGRTHYKTDDRGKTWDEWELGDTPSGNQVPLPIMNFHSGKGKSGYILIAAKNCESDGEYGLCDEKMYYTKDNFKTKPKILLENTHGCTFATAAKNFDGANEDTVLCVVEGQNTVVSEKRRLYISENYFEGGVSKATEPRLDGERSYEGISGIAVVQKFLVVAVKSRGTSEMALFVSKDAKKWARAEFPSDHGPVEEDAYTILESMESTLQVDVLVTKQHNAVGTLFSSNSDGTQFTRILPYTNRDHKGLVDMEPISNIEGIILANVVDNARDLQKSGARGTKKLKTKISFDNGRTWSSIKADGKEIHLHSVTDLTNIGRVFSSPAPGIVMGIGNSGDYLKDYLEGDLYVSEDAGLTWKLSKEGAHKYEIGDQGSIIVAIDDEDKTNKVHYSLDHGKTWQNVDLGLTIRARLLTTTPDSTSTKFVIIANGAPDKDGKKIYIIQLDFSDVRTRTCKKDESGKGDFEKWYARLDEDGKPDCLLGHKQYFWRRKSDADCFVNDLYKEQLPEKEKCTCTKEDYECDINFLRKDGVPGADCIPTNGAKFDDKGKCSKPSDKFMGPSGYRLIPGDDCDKSGGPKLDEEVSRDCSDIKSKQPVSGKVKSAIKSFDGEVYTEQFYIEKADTNQGDDETVMIRTPKGEIWISHNQGEDWKQPSELMDKKIVAIYPNPYYHERVYFLTASETVIYTHDRGKTFKTMKAPGPPNGSNIEVINFHPLRKDYMIWTTNKGCPGDDCHLQTFYTTDEENWKPLLGYVRFCRWIANSYMEAKKVNPNMIFCERLKDQDPKSGKLELVTSHNFFNDETTQFSGIKGFATMEEFIAVAVVDEENKTLKVSTSLDGVTFADAHFPHGFIVPHQRAYTVLESITHAIYLHVTVNDARGAEFGAILKSNSNGTEYVMSLANVNRDESGYVDFERMQGLEGVALANIVSNTKEVVDGATKKLKSMITFNDGGRWYPLSPPKKDSGGHDYSCSGDTDKCSLNIHGYTERRDKRHTYSSASAVGLMMAVGNVGPELLSKKEGDTFLTRDGGMNWLEVHKGAYMWEYGDQGSIIVIVKDMTPTNVISFTTDEGKTWEDYKFTEHDVNVFDISTVPSDTSRRFIVWYKEGTGNQFTSAMIDFTGLTDTKCEFDVKNQDSDDFEFWEPSHPGQTDGCVFGHVTKYNRKIPDKKCYIGRRIPQPHSVVDSNCTCTDHDYECDYNYEQLSDGSCRLVDGLKPLNPIAKCLENPRLIRYFKPTGYRKIPLTTCQGGINKDQIVAEACPGKTDEFNKQYGGGIGGVGIFFLTLLSFGMAAVLGYILYNRWPGKLGAIRLGDETRGENLFVKYGVIAVSAVVAVVAAIPSIVGAIYRVVASRFQRRPRYTARAQFARGAYDNVETDEGELLGEDSDEEV